MNGSKRDSPFIISCQKTNGPPFNILKGPPLNPLNAISIHVKYGIMKRVRNHRILKGQDRINETDCVDRFINHSTILSTFTAEHSYKLTVTPLSH